MIEVTCVPTIDIDTSMCANSREIIKEVRWVLSNLLDLISLEIIQAPWPTVRLMNAVIYIFAHR